MTARTKTIALIAAVPALALGWAAFRPELLFVNQKVDEKPVTTQSAKAMTVASGSFESYAHETMGKAEISEVGGQSVLRLSDFKTSNGPDVHVYLVKGNDPRAVKDGGYIDLGSIKGNIGDQNYTLPAGTDLSQYQAVTIWCKRFFVGFGGAALSMPKTASLTRSGGWDLASYSMPEEIRVTSGKFRADAKGVSGSAELVEQSGKRYVRLKGVKAGMADDAEAYWVKAENFPAANDITKFTKERLGKVDGKAKVQSFPVSKELDAWLYRTVVLYSPKLHKNLGTAELRADQERKGSF
ncbi:MAG: DM13 domain-containing protein [Armatimonadetes bacterium]|nr:DM13 domain-containing protein [Armatimonadota bacterium]